MQQQLRPRPAVPPIELERRARILPAFEWALTFSEGPKRRYLMALIFAIVSREPLVRVACAEMDGIEGQAVRDELFRRFPVLEQELR